MKMNNNEKPIIALAKNKSENDFINAGELLKTLKGDVFENSHEEAPVIIHSADEDGDIHLLNLVYKCSNHKIINFKSGYFDLDEINWNENSIIYADYTHLKNGYIDRKELINILEKINIKYSDCRIEISTPDDDDDFPLTEIFKCSKSCPSVHLTTGYFTDEKN